LGYGLPCLRSTSNAYACSLRAVPCARQRTTLRGRITGSPWYRISSRENEVLPGCWAILGTRAASQTPRRMCVALTMTIDATVAFRAYGPLGIQNMFYFRGLHAAAHALACLRIAGAVADHRRQACFRVIRLDLLGRNSHPQDDKLKFRKPYRMLLLLRPTLPGRYHR